jgi:hypothetical protein
VKPISLSFSPLAGGGGCGCDAANQLEAALDTISALDEERRDVSATSDALLAALVEAARGVKAELERAALTHRGSSSDSGKDADVCALSTSDLLARAAEVIGSVEHALRPSNSPLLTLLRAIAELLRRLRANVAAEALVRVDCRGQAGIKELALRVRAAQGKPARPPHKSPESPNLKLSASVLSVFGVAAKK